MACRAAACVAAFRTPCWRRRTDSDSRRRCTDRLAAASPRIVAALAGGCALSAYVANSRVPAQAAPDAKKQKTEAPGYSAPQRTNPAWKQEMLDGQMKIGCSINTSSPLVTEMCASIGYDFLLIDQQHSAIDPEKLRSLITAAHAGGREDDGARGAARTTASASSRPSTSAPTPSWSRARARPRT